jgi:hypothetical protein
MNSDYVQCPGFVADTGTAKGLGVFASRDIAEGEVVEVAPVVQLAAEPGALPEALRLRAFDWERLAGRAGVCAIVLGYGGVYNHANPANMRCAGCLDGEALRFTAARDIRAGEELTINYNGAGGDIVSSDDNWFRQFDLEPLQPVRAPIE